VTTATDRVRQHLTGLISDIVAFDDQEARHRADVLDWIAGGADLYRLDGPAVPPMHLVSYFLPYHFDTDQVFLVDHRKARRLLPPGGHLEEGETPWEAVQREAYEELAVAARPLAACGERPVFVTVTEVGPHVHQDVSLWHVLALDPDQPVTPDPAEFAGSGWFDRTDVAGWPAGRSDPHMSRFLAKLAQLPGVTPACGPVRSPATSKRSV
jgi:8-oxo-dGTP pyrophosphatase MutT (NUDIX family)